MTFSEQAWLLIIGLVLGSGLTVLGGLVTSWINHHYWQKRDTVAREREVKQVNAQTMWIATDGDPDEFEKLLVNAGYATVHEDGTIDVDPDVTIGILDLEKQMGMNK